MENKIMEHPILLFDGVCNLCNNTIQFCINQDSKGKIHYASLQSDVGQQYLKQFKMDNQDLNTVILIENGQFYTKSDVPLRLVKYFDHKIWRLATVFFVIPKFIRNAVYDYIARNRYKWFGKQDYCMMPNPELKSRFLG